MKSIALIVPYFGKWPIWFDAHLLSIKANKTIDWFFFTDCEIPEVYPENIKFIKISLEQINEKVNKIVDANVPLFPIKFCDLKPAYGEIFHEYISEFDFWGFTDIDIIWGDIRKFITNTILEEYDIISSRKNAISGHFNLFRNKNEINTLYKNIENYRFLFEQPKFMWFDESIFDNYIKSKISNGDFKLKVLWQEILLNHEKGIDSHQEFHLDKWIWNEGRLIDLDNNKEIMYLHFINWKKLIKKNEADYNDSIKSFYISFSKIHLKKHSFLEVKINKIKNIFFGYHAKENIRIKKQKTNSLIKNIHLKMNIFLKK